MRVYDGTRYLVLFGPETYNAIYEIRKVIGVKSGITYLISHNIARIKINSYDFLPLEKTLTLQNVIILIELVFKKYQNTATTIYS